MKVYGSKTIEDRALPDYRDGLKPVYRKILWSMYKSGNHCDNPYSKSARTVGDVIGKYHPHGDAAVYQSMVTMANMPEPMIDGDGNWGGMSDSAAAMRYTNARLSKYSQYYLFDKNLTNTLQYVPNYDDKEVEPVILNSMLPNVIINGSEGIAVGVTSKTPCFSKDSVKELMLKVFSGEEINGKLLANTLDFKYTYGGKCITSKKDLAKGFESSQFSVDITSPYTRPKNNIMLFTEFAPSINMEKVRTRLLGIDSSKRKVKKKKLPVYCEDCRDQSYRDKKAEKNINQWEIKLKKPHMTEANIKKIEKIMTTTMHYKINLTERFKDEFGNCQVTFFSCSLVELIKKWTDWRVSVELGSLKFQIAKTNTNIQKLNLLILARLNIKEVIASLEKDDPESYLSKKLKISLDDAKIILDLRVRQLSKLDEKKLRTELKEVQAHLASLNLYLKNPKAKICSDLKALKV